MGTINVKTQLFRGSLIAVAVLFTATLAQTIASAATTSSQSSNQGTNTFRISPTRTDATIAAGQSKEISTFVTNITGSPITVKPIANDFVAGDEEGNPSLILDENEFAPTHSLKRYMKPLSAVTIQPGERKEIKVTVAIPEDAAAGGYYGALRYAPVDPSGEQQLSLSASAASLILVTVPGDLVENLELTNFDIQQEGETVTKLSSADDVKLLLRFQSRGNVQVYPFGKIYVKKGDKVVYDASFNQEDPKDSVLPDSARRWELPLQGFGSFGKYEIGGTFTYGTSNKTIEIAKTIWIIPTSLILLVVGGIIALVALIIAIRSFLKSYKKKILAQSRHR